MAFPLWVRRKFPLHVRTLRVLFMSESNAADWYIIHRNVVLYQTDVGKSEMWFESDSVQLKLKVIKVSSG